MSYKKATEVLPIHLLEEVQRYISHGLLYIPKAQDQKIGWGQQSGAREMIDARNADIVQAYQDGESLDNLCTRYFLSEETIRKIVVGRK